MVVKTILRSTCVLCLASSNVHSQSRLIQNAQSYEFSKNSVFTIKLNNLGDGRYHFATPLYDPTVVQLVNTRYAFPEKTYDLNEPLIGNFGVNAWDFKVISTEKESKITVQAEKPSISGDTLSKITVFWANIIAR
jgi:hypothetical protein